MTDDPEGTDGAGPGDYGAPARFLAGVLLVGALALAYISADVLAGGRITHALMGTGR